MAYIESFAIKEENASVLTHTANMPVHVTNDLLVALFSKDGTGTHSVATSGWVQVGSTQSSNGVNVSSVWYKIAASSSETAPACTTNTNDGWVSMVLCIKDADTSNPIDNSVLSSNAAASQFTQAAVTPNTADCLILYLLGVDGASNSALCNPGVHHIFSFDNAGTTYGACAAAAWTFQRAASASMTCGWTSSLSQGTNRFTISIKNKSGGRIPAYVDDAIAPGTVITPAHHVTSLNGISFPGSLSISSIGSKTLTNDNATVTVDYGINPYSAAFSETPATTPVANLTATQMNFSSTIDMSAGFVMGSVIANTPKSANYYLGTIYQGGRVIAFLDASNNYYAYQTLAMDSKPNPEGRVVWCVKPSQTTTAYATSGTLSTNAVSKMIFSENCPLSSVILYNSEIHQIGTFVIAGGDSTTPVDVLGLESIGKSFRLPVIQKTGASSLLSYTPIQVGGGDAVNFQIDAGALQFPRIYSSTLKEVSYHASAKDIGISYYGVSGDVIKHTNSVITSPSEYYWSIHASATSSATWDFNGLTISGAYVTLRNVMTFIGMTFANCTAIIASSCSLDGCNITKVPASNDSLTINSSSNIDNCTINVTQVTTGNRLCSIGDPTVFSGCTFTGSESSGHAIRITTPGTYSFVGNVFNSFGANGTNYAAIFNDSGGLVTLNVSGGGNSPTYRNGTDASTTVNNTKVLTLTGLVTNSEVRIYTHGTTTELAGIENSGTSFDYNYTYAASTYVDIVVHKADKLYYRIDNYLLVDANASIPIAQQTDRQYYNP